MILQKAQQATITDATFTLTLSVTSSSTTVTGTGNGKFTTNPKRADLSLTLTVSGVQAAAEVIEDGATNTSYTKFTSPPQLATGKWTKASTASSLIDASSLINYSQLSNVTLVGKDTVNGVAVWHLKGSSTSSSAGGTVDLYLRQDNYYPVKFDLALTGTSAGDFTIVFTAVNSGITINLPPPSQVQ